MNTKAAVIVGLSVVLACAILAFIPQLIPRSEAESITPAVGTACQVHFRRDILGSASSDRILSIGSLITSNGDAIVLAGTLVKMDRDWLVLKVDYETDELWIPRKGILYLTVEREKSL